MRWVKIADQFSPNGLLKPLLGCIFGGGAHLPGCKKDKKKQKRKERKGKEERKTKKKEKGKGKGEKQKG